MAASGDDSWQASVYHSPDKPIKSKYIVFTTKRPVGCTVDDMDKTDKDLHSLTTGLFEHYGKPEDVEIKEKCCVKGFTDYIEYLKTENSLKDYNCFFFIFLTFASGNQLHFKDGLLDLADIIDDIQTIRYMAGWPKVILIQADDLSLINVPQGPEVKKIKIPTDADRLVVMSTVPVQYATMITGGSYSGASFLIQAFLAALEENEGKEPGERLDLLSLTVDINSRFNTLLDTLGEDKPMAKQLPLPITTSTLRKLLYL